MAQFKKIRVHEKMSARAYRAEVSVKRQDSVQWVKAGRSKFKIIGLSPIKAKNGKKSPSQPFYRPFPNSKDDFAAEVCSGPAVPDAVGSRYKTTIEFADGTVVDPVIIIKP